MLSALEKVEREWENWEVLIFVVGLGESEWRWMILFEKNDWRWYNDWWWLGFTDGDDANIIGQLG